MLKARLVLTWIISLFLILSSTAFAQYGGNNYEGRAIDPSREGIDYYMEGDVIVYPANSGSGNMRDRYMDGDFDEDNMRKGMMEKFGDDFDEGDFQKKMMESRERMERRESFSYENEGYENMYNEGPSYEGYSKDQMIFGMVFHYIGDEIDPREIMQYCSEPEKIADIVIGKIRENIGDVQNICGRIEEQETKCKEQASKSCEQIGKPYVKEGASEMEKINALAYSCPPNKNALIEACRKRNENHIKQQTGEIDKACENRFASDGQRRIRECDEFRQNMICDKEKFISQCMGGIKKDVNDEKMDCPIYSPPPCSNGVIITKYDNNGCPYPNCEVKSKCPENPRPDCGPGTAIKEKRDSNNCIYYYCENSTPSCPKVSQPSCSSEERLEASYDSKGCVTNYQCVRYEICPEPIEPTCSGNNTIVSKSDEKGCIFYECSVSDSKITGAVTGAEFDNRQKNCGEMWNSQRRTCENKPKICDKKSFMENCREEGKKYAGQNNRDLGIECQSLIEPEIKAIEDRCSRLKEEKSKCISRAASRCGQMAGLSGQCRTLLTEENLRKFIIEEAKKRCRFSDIIEHKDEIEKSDRVEIILAVLNTAAQSDIEKLELFVDGLKEELRLEETTVYKGTISPKIFGDIKLLPFVVNAKISASSSSDRSKNVKEGIVAGSIVKKAAGKLVSLRDSNVPSEYLYIIEDKANDVLDAADALEDVENKEEEKGFGYKIRLFLGMAKAAEQVEIKQLEGSKLKLQSSIDTLATLADEVPGDVAKAILKEQVENLKKQLDEIQILIETKEKKSKGLFGVFG